MGLQVVHYQKDDKKQWGIIHNDKIISLTNSYNSLAHFLEDGIGEANEVIENGKQPDISIENVTILSPVTKPARIVCQGANYSTHRKEAGLDAERPPFNLIFSKADSSLTGAYTNIIRPSHVELLDYEIELGLILGKEITNRVEVTEANIHEYVAGIVIANDVSARDVQLPEGQWLKGKSYRTFCPTGPFLYLLDKEEVAQIHNLDLNLWVNDELRQSANTDQLLYKPEETLTELSELMDLSTGDMVITGTTGGVALHLSSEEMNNISTASPKEKKRIFVESQMNNGSYLQDGDVIRAEIKSPDEKIYLGKQQSTIVPGK